VFFFCSTHILLYQRLCFSFLDLNNATDSESRLTALCVVCVEFDHTDTIKHNAELYYGAITILSKTLSMTDNHDEIRMICSAIEMAFRGSAKYVKEAYHINGSTMFPILLRLLDRCEQSKMRYADEIILNITKTFHYLSKIPQLRASLVRQPGVLDSMQRVATTPLNVVCRNARVRVIANLANCDDNKVVMFAHRGLLGSLLKIAQLDLADATREYATNAIMDLASAPANQIPLAKNGQVIRVLTTMVVTERVAGIRECAITTLQNLAFAQSNRRRLVDFQQGLVLESLKTALVNDSHIKGRRRAGGALTNLACDETAEKMGSHPDLLPVLAKVAVNDGSKDVQVRACLALTKIAANISIKSKCYEDMLDALVIAADTIVENNISAVFRFISREAECRESMARHPGVLNKLADICIKQQSSVKDRNNATRTIMHLSNENVNRVLMCNSRILEALVTSISIESGEDPLSIEMQDSAIRALARLATEVSNRPRMAQHLGLLAALAKATEREAKLEAKLLMPEQQAFLSKPLLMSLLIAMK
jgi:hypothetical protein